MSFLADPTPMNPPKVECVVCAINNLGSSEDIRVDVCDERSLGEDDRSSLKFSHMTLSAETYRRMGLMVGDRVTLEMAKVPDHAK
jgi:hypothetical protein